MNSTQQTQMIHRIDHTAETVETLELLDCGPGFGWNLNHVTYTKSVPLPGRCTQTKHRTKAEGEKAAKPIHAEMLAQHTRILIGQGKLEEAERLRERAVSLGCTDEDMQDIIEFPCQYAIVDAPGYAMGNKACIAMAGNDLAYLRGRLAGFGAAYRLVEAHCDSNDAWVWADVAHRRIIA